MKNLKEGKSEPQQPHLTVHYAKNTMARPTFPTGVDTGGTIWLPGIQVSLSLSLGPSFTSISNRCIFRYTATMEPLSFTMTCELRSLLSSGGPYDLKVYEKGKTILMTTEMITLNYLPKLPNESKNNYFHCHIRKFLTPAVQGIQNS